MTAATASLTEYLVEYETVITLYVDAPENATPEQIAKAMDECDLAEALEGWIDANDGCIGSEGDGKFSYSVAEGYDED